MIKKKKLETKKHFFFFFFQKHFWTVSAIMCGTCVKRYLSLTFFFVTNSTFSTCAFPYIYIIGIWLFLKERSILRVARVYRLYIRYTDISIPTNLGIWYTWHCCKALKISLKHENRQGVDGGIHIYTAVKSWNCDFTSMQSFL